MAVIKLLFQVWSVKTINATLVPEINYDNQKKLLMEWNDGARATEDRFWRGNSLEKCSTRGQSLSRAFRADRWYVLPALNSPAVQACGHGVYQYWAHRLSPLTLLTKWNRKFPLQKELMFPQADVFPIQLVLMKLVLSGYWGRKNRHKCLMVIKDTLRRKGSDTRRVFLSGEKCLYQGRRSQWLRKQWVVWASNDA